MCPTDPLLFTCNVTGTPSNTITVTFPHDVTIILRSTGMVDGDDPPAGVTVFHANSNITGDYILSLSIANASLLNDGNIICDPGVRNRMADMAECPVAGKCSM